MIDSSGREFHELPYVGGRDESGPVSDVSATAGVGRKMAAEDAIDIPVHSIQVAVTRETRSSESPACGSSHGLRNVFK